MTGSISVIIPTKNEENFLPRLLASIKRQTLKPLEIIVADNLSTDRTPDITRKSGAFLIDGGLAFAGRNNGARVARGDIFIFMDADTLLPEETTLETAINLFESQNLDVATSTVKLDKESQKKPLAWLFCYLIWNPGLCLSNIFGVPLAGGGQFIICRRNVFFEINGFSPIAYGEDYDFSMKTVETGFKLRTLPLKIIASGRHYHDLKKAIGGIAGLIFFFFILILGLSDHPKLTSLNYKIYCWPVRV